MARILAMSSQVVSGHVGLSAIVPALLALGHEVLALPTIVLSNHPGRQPASSTRIAPAVLDEMLTTLAANGRLAGIDAVLTGYLPSAEHVTVASRAIDMVRAQTAVAVVLCDPVIGDDPKGLYIDPAAAAAIRDVLVPMADIVTPNRFELAWLTGEPVPDADGAIRAARHLGRPVSLASSVPADADKLATLAVTPSAVFTATVRRHAQVPNGTGDLLAALFLAALLAQPRLSDAELSAALATAVAQVDQVLADSDGRDEMHLTPAMNAWRAELTSTMDKNLTTPD